MNTSPPLRLGITGGIGCGKSTVGKILAAQGWHVIDTDDIARQLLTSDAETISATLSAWPSAGNPDGSINRQALARIVFNDTRALHTLNSITHHKIRTVWHTQRESAFRAGHSTAVIIPLLHEVGAAKEFDYVLCVGCSRTTQLPRLRQRGWSENDIHLRLRTQLPLEKKAELSDFFLWNEGSENCLCRQITALKLRSKNQTTQTPPA
jgi:dephospho-CoA kinase